MKIKRKIKIILLFLLFVFLCMQLYRPTVYVDKSDNVKTARFAKQVDAIFEKACYNCHSNQTDLKWFDQIAPANWLVANHVKKARQAMNFSTWAEMTKAEQNAKLWEAFNHIMLGAMPIKSYTLLHNEAKLSPADLQVLKDYMNRLALKQVKDTAKVNALEHQYKKWSVEKADFRVQKLPVDINGITFIADYKNWTPISSTQRIDNGTMRIIFGNDIAIKAIGEHHTNPWPNGTILAKASWDQLKDEQGNIVSGAFKQVEYMIKNDQKYKSTAGWGWARFKTPKFVPFGKTTDFTKGCINCHRPMQGNDFVFTAPIKH